jgi:predicted DNA-binding transcriptional regulator AlpA
MAPSATASSRQKRQPRRLEHKGKRSAAPLNPYAAVLRPAAAATFLGLSRSTLYRLERAGALAPRVQLGPCSSGWMREDLEVYLAQLPRGARETGTGQPSASATAA